MDKFLKYKTEPGRNRKYEKPITSNEIESVKKTKQSKNLSNKGLGPYGFTGEFYQTFREELTSKKIAEEGTSKLILWDQNHLDIKTRQGCKKNKIMGQYNWQT